MIPRTHWLSSGLALVGAWLLLLSPLPASAAVASDDFNDNLLNDGLWQLGGGGSGPKAEEREQRLEMELPSTSSGELFFASIQARPLFRGDLDVQVDFELLQYPQHNGVRLGIVLQGGASFASVQRTSLGEAELLGDPRETYILASGDTLGRHPTGSSNGKLRLTRIGTTVTGYYWDGATESWLPFASATNTTADLRLALSAWSHDEAFADQDVRVAFDNFIVNKGQMIGPALPDLTGRWQQLRQRTRGTGESQVATVRGIFSVKNSGSAPAGPSVLRFFLSSDAILSDDDVPLHQQTLRVLRPRQRQQVRLVKGLPPGTSAAGRFVIAVVDATSAVAESNEFAHAVPGGPLR